MTRQGSLQSPDGFLTILEDLTNCQEKIATSGRLVELNTVLLGRRVVYGQGGPPW